MDLDQLEKGLKDFLISNCIDITSLNGILVLFIDPAREKIDGEVRKKKSLKTIKISKSSKVISA